MKIAQAERAILSAMFVDKGVIGIVKPELTADKFVFGPASGGKFNQAHQLIYAAMIKVQGRVDVVSVARELGDKLTDAGGEKYLTFLSIQALQQLGIHSTEGLPQWVNVVDTSGRLKQLGDIIETYGKLYEDFSVLVEQVKDVDLFASDLQQRISRVALGTASTSYQHISSANAHYGRILEDEANGVILSYYPVGWPSFEKFALPPQAAMMVISGLSGMGKTQLMLQLALGIAIQIKANDVPGCVAINSYEMPGWRLSRRLAACLAGVDYQGAAVRKEGSTAYKCMHNALAFVDTLPIYYDDSDMSSTQIAMQCLRLQAQHECLRFLGVDYAELVDLNKDTRNEELRVSSVFRNIQKFCHSNGMCGCVLSQLTGAEMYPTKIVPYTKLRYSSGGTHAADVVSQVYNPPQMNAMRLNFQMEDTLGSEDQAYLIIQKNRDGKLGYIPLHWTADITRFEDPVLIGFGKGGLYRNLDKLGFINGQFVEEDDF